MFGRRNIAAVVAEFLGTGILTLLVLSVQRSTIGVPFFVALAAGLTLTMLYFAVGTISGGYFNPALSVAMLFARRLTFIKTLLYVVAQFLGAYAAYRLYAYYANSMLQPIGGTPTMRIAVAEGVGALLLAFGFAAAAFQSLSTGARAAVNGISYVVAVVAASSAAIGLVNPAVTVGVRASNWAYLAAPFVGAVIGALVYKYIFNGNEDVAPALVPVAAATSIQTSSTGETTQTTTVVARKPRKKAATKTTTAARTRKSTTTRKTPAKRAPRARKTDNN